MRILFIGDIVGKSGRAILLDRLPKLIAAWQLDFVVVNGENAAGGFGITEAIYQEFLDAGADASGDAEADGVPDATPERERGHHIAAGQPRRGGARCTRDRIAAPDPGGPGPRRRRGRRTRTARWRA